MLSESSEESDSSEYDAWEHMCGDAFEDSERGFVALVAVYMDAAYNHPKGITADDPRVMTIASYTAEQDDWRKTRKEWRQVLLEFGNIPFFHMKDFEHARNVTRYGKGQISSKSPYSGWTLERLDSLELALFRVINRKRPDKSPRITAIHSNILLADYEETLPDDLKDHPRCRSPFILTAANIMDTIAVWANARNHHDPIHYIFAGGDNETGNLDRLFTRWFDRDITINHFRLAKGFGRIGYDLQWMKGEPALQAVDCPAYEMNRAVIEWAKKDFNPILKSELRASLSLLCRIDHFGLTLRKPELLETYRDIRINDRQLGFRK